MNLIKLINTLSALALLIPSLAAAETRHLEVRIKDAQPDIGTIEVSLFNSAESFLKETHLQQSGPPSENGDFVAVFANLEQGEYAVVAVHDENGNELYDSGFLGFGGEGLGYSNNFRPWFGRPDFDDVKFSLDKKITEIEISIP